MTVQKHNQLNYKSNTGCLKILTSFRHVAVTDLFSLANLCPCQVIRPLTDQSAGRAH